MFALLTLGFWSHDLKLWDISRTYSLRTRAISHFRLRQCRLQDALLLKRTNELSVVLCIINPKIAKYVVRGYFPATVAEDHDHLLLPGQIELDEFLKPHNVFRRIERFVVKRYRELIWTIKDFRSLFSG